MKVNASAEHVSLLMSQALYGLAGIRGFDDTQDSVGDGREMKRKSIILVLVILAILVVIACLVLKIKPVFSSCKSLQHLTPKEIQYYESVSGPLMTAIDAGNGAELFRKFYAPDNDGPSITSLENILLGAKMQYGNLTTWTLNKIFEVRGSPGKSAGCVGDYRISGPSQASKHVLVIYEAETDADNKVHIGIQLVPDSDEWWISDIIIFPKELHGMTYSVFKNKANTQLDDQNVMSALMYLHLAWPLMVNQGGTLSTQSATDFENLMQDLPSEALNNSQTEIWTVESGKEFEIWGIYSTRISGVNALQIWYLTKDFNNPAQMDNDSIEIANYVLSTFPEIEFSVYPVLRITATDHIPAPEEMESVKAYEYRYILT